MNGWVVLRRARITLLGLLALICLTWAILFAVFLHHEWSYCSLIQKILVVGLLSLYIFTAILLYLMAVVHYCPWWDVVRMFAIFVVHIVSSVFFTHNRSNFPCRGFGTETACKEYILTVSVGSWVLSVTFLCFSMALGVMAFMPQPVESLPGTEEDGLPSNPDWFKASSLTADELRASLSSLPVITYHSESLSPYRNICPMNSDHRVITPRLNEDDELPSNPGWFKVGSPTADEPRNFLPSTYTGVVTHNNELREESLSSDRNASPVNSIHSSLEPPHFWQNFENRNSRRSNETGSHGGTLFMRNTPGGGTSIDSGSLRVGTFSPYSFHDSSTPPSFRLFAFAVTNN